MGSALVDMYAKCGCLEIARQVFDKIPQRNVVSWTAMIARYAQNGHGIEALDLFREMQLDSVETNSVTIASLLPATSQLGILHPGSEIHAFITKIQLETYLNVENALVDMYDKRLHA